LLAFFLSLAAIHSQRDIQFVGQHALSAPVSLRTGTRFPLRSGKKAGGSWRV
jgi:hypothetical protein